MSDVFVVCTVTQSFLSILGEDYDAVLFSISLHHVLERSCLMLVSCENSFAQQQGTTCGCESQAGSLKHQVLDASVRGAPISEAIILLLKIYLLSIRYTKISHQYFFSKQIKKRLMNYFPNKPDNLSIDQKVVYVQK